MDLKVFGATLIRRFDLSIIALLLAVGVGLSLSHLSGPRYTAVSSVVLIPPPSTVSNATTTSAYAPPNPLLYLGGLTQSRDLLLRTLDAQQVGDDIKQRFPAVTYSVSGDSTSAGPLLIVTTISANEQQTLDAMRLLNQRIPSTLQAIQVQLKITADNRITSLVLASDDTPAVDHKSQLQTSVFGAGLVALLGLLLVALADNVMTSRRGRSTGGSHWWTRRRNRDVPGMVKSTIPTSSEPQSVGERRRDPGPPNGLEAEGEDPGPSPTEPAIVEPAPTVVHRIPEVAADAELLSDDVSADLRRRVSDLDYGSPLTPEASPGGPRRSAATGRR